MSDIAIRAVRSDDALALYEIRQQQQVIAGTLHLPTERLSATQQYLATLGPDTHVLVAEVDGKMVGALHMQAFSGKRRHVASIGLMVHDGYSGRGVGKSLMRRMLDIADNHLDIKRLELELMESNGRALRLYESFGFALEGRKRKAVYLHGRYEDVLLMARFKPE